MANTFVVNQILNTPASINNGVAALFHLKNQMVVCGWDVVASGNGTGGYSATGDVWLTVSDFPTNAWIVLQMPGSSRQILFQDENNSSLRFYYSFDGLFTGGSSAVRATATDEKVWLGFDHSGLNFGLQISQGGGPAAVMNIMCQDAAPYGFWMTLNANTVFCETLVAMDPIANGTGIPGDLDPYVFIADYGSSGGTTAAFYGIDAVNSSPSRESQPNASGYGARAWIAKDEPSQCWRGVAWLAICNNLKQNEIVNALGVNPFNGNDQLINVSYAGVLNNGGIEPIPGWKGTSSLFWFISTNRLLGDAFTVDTVRDYRSFRGMAAAWNGSEPVAS